LEFSHNKKPIFMALLANITISISKFIGFLITGSSSMLAETVHSLADSCNQLLLILGDKRARRRASKSHQFGYGQERYFYSFMVALTIFFVGGLFAIYEAVNKLNHPHALNYPLVAIVILIVAIIMEFFSLRAAVKVSNLTRNGKSWGAFIRQSKNPELTVLLLEDLAALLGLFFALFGVLLSLVTGNGIFDTIATFFIGSLLIVVALVLGLEMKSLLIGEAVGVFEENVIIENIKSFSEVKEIIHMRTLHLAPDEILLAVKIAVDPNMLMAEVSLLLDNIEKKIRESNKSIRLIYIEPDTKKEAKST
jgi:cation diffusion facilitator family transporter